MLDLYDHDYPEKDFQPPELTAAQRARLGVAAGWATVLAVALGLWLILSLAGCAGRNQPGGNPPKSNYPLHWLARDISVGGWAFLEEAKKNHGSQCDAPVFCDPAKDPSIKDGQKCVTICNSIKMAAILHANLNLAIDAVCGGEDWRKGTAPCRLADDAQQRADAEAQLQGAMDAYTRAEAQLKAARGTP